MVDESLIAHILAYSCQYCFTFGQHIIIMIKVLSDMSLMTHKIKYIAACLSVVVLTGCANNIQPVGMLGPNRLKVYVIKNNDFLSSSRMLVVLDKKGNVSAYSGNTVSGAGSEALQTAGTIVSAGAVVVGARSIQSGLQHTQVSGIPNSLHIKGIPQSVNVNTNSHLSVN